MAKQSATVTRTPVGSDSRPARGSAPRLQPVAGAEQGAESGVEEGALALDRLIHERMRLGIVSALAVNHSLSFNELKRLLDTTDGNLSVHARKLEEANYIVCTKSFAGRMPRTEYRLSSVGRRALERYLDHMEALIHSTRDR